MRLRPLQTISLRLTSALTADELPRSEVLVAGKPTETVVTGAVLEAALQWHDSLLLMVTDDILHEDTLRIYLLDSRLNLIDWATIGAMYATGALSQLDLSAEDGIRFHFMGDTAWTLTLFPTRRLASPAPPGVRRPWAMFHRFALSGSPARASRQGSHAD